MFKNKIKTALMCLAILASFFAVAAPAMALGKPCKDPPQGEPLQKQVNQNCITQDINTIVTGVSAAVGVVIVANVIIGGIQYSAAGGSPQKVTEARKRIGNGFIALFAFLLLFAFVQWLIPGGVFG